MFRVSLLYAARTHARAQGDKKMSSAIQKIHFRKKGKNKVKYNECVFFLLVTSAPPGYARNFCTMAHIIRNTDSQKMSTGPFPSNR